MPEFEKARPASRAFSSFGKPQNRTPRNHKQEQLPPARTRSLGFPGRPLRQQGRDRRPSPDHSPADLPRGREAPPGDLTLQRRPRQPEQLGDGIALDERIILHQLRQRPEGRRPGRRRVRRSCLAVRKRLPSDVLLLLGAGGSIRRDPLSAQTIRNQQLPLKFRLVPTDDRFDRRWNDAPCRHLVPLGLRDFSRKFRYTTRSRFRRIGADPREVRGFFPDDPITP